MQQRLLPEPNPTRGELLLSLVVSAPGGRPLTAEAASGYHVMELVRAFGVPIKAECGGAGVCATCHVRIPERWQSLLSPASDEELAKLDDIPEADDSSRLACQIFMTDALDGLELEVQADSLAGRAGRIAV